MIAIALWACALISAAVFATMIYSVASFRSLHEGRPAALLRSTMKEVLWALIPIAILVGTAVPAVKTLVTSDSSRSETTDSAEVLRQASTVQPQ